MTQQLMRRRRPYTATSIDHIDLWNGYLYIVKAGELYKIGFSKTPRKRFRTFRTGSPVPLEVVYTLKTPFYKHVEKILHDRLAEKRVHGEWFALTEVDVDYIKQMDRSGQSLRSRAYCDAYQDAFDAAGGDLNRTESQRLGAIAGAESNARAQALGCPCDW